MDRADASIIHVLHIMETQLCYYGHLSTGFGYIIVPPCPLPLALLSRFTRLCFLIIQAAFLVLDSRWLVGTC